MSTETKAPISKRFRCGLKPNAPAWCVTVAGHTFPKRTQKHRENNDVPGEVEKENVPGEIHFLTDNDLKLIEDRVKPLIFRHTLDSGNQRVYTSVVDTTMNGYSKQENEEPVAPHLYIKFEPTDPELLTDKDPYGILSDISNALKASEAESKAGEVRAVAEPRDAKIREDHAKAKAAGSKVA